MTTVMTNTDAELVSRLRGLWDYAKKAKQPRYRLWERNYAIVNNALAGNAGAESWMPLPRTSEVYPILANLVAWMADQHVSISADAAVEPGSDFGDFITKMCADLTAVLMARWENGHFEQQCKLSLWDAFMYGSGIFKSAWDDSVHGGLGDTVLRRVDPWSFYPDPRATSMDDMEFAVEVRLMSVDEIERRFPDSALYIDAKNFAGGYNEIPQRPEYGQALPNTGSVNTIPSTYSGTQPPGILQSRASNGNIQPTRNIAVYEFWTRENDYDFDIGESGGTVSERQVYDDWTVTVVARGEVLLREQARDLWTGGWQPYSRYAYDDIGEFWGIALVDHMAYPQIYINRLLTAMQTNYELTGQPVLLEQTGSGTERAAWTNRPGTRMPVKANAGGTNLPRYLQPPSMPAQVMELLQFHIDRMENVAGISSALKGAGGTSGRTTAGVMSAIQESAFVRIRAGLSNFEFTIEDAGNKLAELMIENYTIPRVVAITGPDGEQTSLALKSRPFDMPTPDGATPLSANITIDAGSEMPTSLQARNAKAEKFYMLGAIDREAFLKDVNYPNRQEVIDRINQQQQAGTWAPPGARARSGRSS